jgi:hypothetical protein
MTKSPLASYLLVWESKIYVVRVALNLCDCPRAATVREVPFTQQSIIIIFCREFAEQNRRAMDAIWFKRAVDQHNIEPDSFVFSVPHNSGPRGEKPLVTASHAVFIEDKGHRAPAMVVGLQFQHSALASHFINITSAVS